MLTIKFLATGGERGRRDEKHIPGSRDIHRMTIGIAPNSDIKIK
jgi:hypothetical protein